MALILARSPYFISRGNLDDDATMSVDIGFVTDSGSETVLKTLLFSFRQQKKIDISPFIRDYFDDYEILQVKTTINGSLSGVIQDPVTTTYLSTDGYSYYEEGYNYDPSVF